MRSSFVAQSKRAPTDGAPGDDNCSSRAEGDTLELTVENPEAAPPFYALENVTSAHLVRFNEGESNPAFMQPFGHSTWSNLLQPAPQPHTNSIVSAETTPPCCSDELHTSPSRTVSIPSVFLSSAERRHTMGYGGSFGTYEGVSGGGHSSGILNEPRPSLLQPLDPGQIVDGMNNMREQNRSTMISILERRKEVLLRQLEHACTDLYGKSIFAIVRASDASRLQYLLEQRLCNVNERDYNGSTPLHVAALGGNQSIVRVLISFGADVMATDKKGSTPLDWAAANRQSGVFRYLLAVTRYVEQQQKEGNTTSSVKFVGDPFRGSVSASFPSQAPRSTRGASLPMQQSATTFSQSYETPGEGREVRRPGGSWANNSVILAALPPDLVSVFRSEAEEKNKEPQALTPAAVDLDDDELLEELRQPSEKVLNSGFRRFSSYTTVYDTTSLVVCMVGLPGRGKSFICNRLSRYLNWKGVACRVFNAGQYRRQLLGVEGTNESAFYDPNNSRGKEMREQMADLACEDLMNFLTCHKCAVGVFDATNTTRARRGRLETFFTRAAKQRQVECRVIFIESICTDDTIITENILRSKCGNDDFKDVTDTVEVISSFRSRIAQYEKVYEPLDPSEGLSYMQIVNVKRHVILYSIPYGLATRITFFLMNLHPVAYPAYVALPGETESDRQHLYGGDGRLTSHGRHYSEALKQFIQERYVPHMVVLHGTNPDVLTTLKPLADGAGANVTASSPTSVSLKEGEEDECENTERPEKGQLSLSAGGNCVSYPSEMLCQLPTLDGINYGRFCGHTADWVRANYAKLSGLLYTMSLGGSTDSLRSPTEQQEVDTHEEEEHREKSQCLPVLHTQCFEKNSTAVRHLRHVPNGTDPRLSYCVQFPNGESCRQVNVRLEPVLMAVMRSRSPVFVVASAVPAQGVLAFLMDVLPELSPTLRVPRDSVVEIGVGGEVKVHQLLHSSSSNELILED